MKSDKFIGIPYKLNGNDFEGTDCVGLCRLVYQDEGWPETFWDNGEEITHENMGSNRVWARLTKYLNKHFRRVDGERYKYGDIIVFNVRGDAHMGVFIQDDLVLTQMVPVVEGETKSTLYHKGIWELGFMRAYRRKGDKK